MDRRDFLGLMAVGTAGTLAGCGQERPRAQARADAVGMLYDSTLCIGCRTCVQKCKESNGLPLDRNVLDGVTYNAPEDQSGTAKTVIKLYAEGDKQAFVKAQCMHCIDPSCVSACMLGALQKREYGVVTYERDRCVGCRYCQIACPFTVPKFEWNSATPQIVKCEMCHHRFAEGKGPACAEVCPRQAIIFGKYKDLLTEARRRIEQNPDRYVPKIFGERDVGGTQVLHIAGLEFEKLGFPKVGEDPVPEMGETIQHGIYKGFIAPIALYATTAYVVVRNLRKGQVEQHGHDHGHEDHKEGES
jgi:Fe-S-cluster-containing dehydrogenase component